LNSKINNILTVGDPGESKSEVQTMNSQVTTSPDGQGPQAVDDLPVARSGLVIATMCLAVVLVIAAVAGLNVAIPSIGGELGASQSDLQWIVDAFALTLAALLLPMGALGDRFGRRRLMLIGFGVFVGAAIWAALAGSIGALIAARAVGGFGAAMIFPGTLSTLTSTMPPSRRGTAIGMWTASASLGGTIGALLAGGLVGSFWFGSVFVATAVVGVAVGLMTWVFVPETSDPSHAHIDPLGSILSLVGIGGLVLAITEGPVKGWSHEITVAGLVAAAVGLIGFVVWELRTTTPLLDVRLFQLRGFSTGSLSIFVQFLVVFGFFFVSAQYFAFVSGYGPFRIAAAWLPVGILLPVMSTKAPQWSVRFGRGVIGAIGLTCMAIGTAIFATMDVSPSYWLFAMALVLFGAGMGLSAPPATEAIVEALPTAKQGVASAINDVSRELGGALGIAIIGSAFTAGYRSSVDDAASVLPAGSTDAVRESAVAGYQVAAQAGAGGGRVVEVVQSSVSQGFAQAMWLATSALVVGAIYVAVRTPRTLIQPAAPASEPVPAALRPTINL
jgi:EmrB/QacA subfamily drug resistance transporter